MARKYTANFALLIISLVLIASVSITSLIIGIASWFSDISNLDNIIFQGSLDILKNLRVGRNVLIHGNVTIEGSLMVESVIGTNFTSIKGDQGDTGSPGVSLFL